MDKSELYKDMCFKARELQGVFHVLADKGEVFGSWVFVKWGDPDSLGGLEDVMLHPSAVYGLERLDHDWYVCNGILRGKICREPLEEIDPRAQVVWLPSADQLKALRKPFRYIQSANSRETYVSANCESNQSWISQFGATEEQTWLKVTMAATYFKEWSGSDWVAINNTEEPN